MRTPARFAMPLAALLISAVVSADEDRQVTLPLIVLERNAIERVNERKAALEFEARRLHSDTAEIASAIRSRLGLRVDQDFDFDPRESAEAPHGSIVLVHSGTAVRR